MNPVRVALGWRAAPYFSRDTEPLLVSERLRCFWGVPRPHCVSFFFFSQARRNNGTNGRGVRVHEQNSKKRGKKKRRETRFFFMLSHAIMGFDAHTHMTREKGDGDLHEHFYVGIFLLTRMHSNVDLRYLFFNLFTATTLAVHSVPRSKDSRLPGDHACTHQRPKLNL